MILLLFFIGCWTKADQSIEDERKSMEAEQAYLAEKAKKEVTENENDETVEKDPEESKTDGASNAGDENSSTDNEAIEASQEDIFAFIPIYPNIEEVQNESYDHDNQKYSLFAFTSDAPDAVYNWYKDESESIGWEIWKEYDEEGGFIANYKDFRLVLTIVLIEDNFYPDTRITMNVR